MNNHHSLPGSRDLFQYIIDANKNKSQTQRDDFESSSQESSSSREYQTADEMEIGLESNSEPMDTSNEEMHSENHQFNSTNEVEELQTVKNASDNILTKEGHGPTDDKSTTIYKNKKTGVEFEVEKMPFSNNM